MKRELIESESAARRKSLFFFFLDGPVPTGRFSARGRPSCNALRKALFEPLAPFNVGIVREEEGGHPQNSNFSLAGDWATFPKPLCGCDQIFNSKLDKFIYFIIFLVAGVKPFRLDAACFPWQSNKTSCFFRGCYSWFIFCCGLIFWIVYQLID